jgi:hypothetical protein
MTVFAFPADDMAITIAQPLCALGMLLLNY